MFNKYTTLYVHKFIIPKLILYSLTYKTTESLEYRTIWFVSNKHSFPCFNFFNFGRDGEMEEMEILAIESCRILAKLFTFVQEILKFA